MNPYYNVSVCNTNTEMTEQTELILQSKTSFFWGGGGVNGGREMET